VRFPDTGLGGTAAHHGGVPHARLTHAAEEISWRDMGQWYFGVPGGTSRMRVLVALVAASLVAWFFVVVRMQGMDDGPGTDLGSAEWYVGIWVTMMAAMMLPSVSPMVLAFARVTRERSSRGQAAFVPTWVFLGGYLAAWTAYGQARDQREMSCAYLTSGGVDDRTYEKLSDVEKSIADTMDCDIEGR